MLRTWIRLSVFVLLLLAAAAPLAADTREYEAHKLKWTVPEGWTIGDPTAGQTQAGYVATAANPDVPIQFFLMARATEDLPLSDLKAEVLGVIQNSIFGDKLKGSATGDGSLAGVPGFLIRGQGEANANACYTLAWGIEKGGRFYTLLAMAYHGAHQSEWQTIDEVRRGVTLTEGGGAETPATGPWPDLEGQSAESGGELVWPEQGPTREGNVITFAEHNLRWTLPDDTPFAPTWVIDDATKIDTRVLDFQATIAGEGDKLRARCLVQLVIQQRKPNSEPDVLVYDIGFQSQFAEQFKERTPGGTSIDSEAEFAGGEGAFIQMKGKNEDGSFRTASILLGAHSTKVYGLRVTTVGERDCERQFAKALAALFAGLVYIDPNEPVPGPLAAGVAPAFGPRGQHADEEREIKATRVAFMKPAGYARLTGLAQGLKFGIEGRSEDKQAYFYLDVQVVKIAALTQARKTLEDLVKDRASAWKSDGGESAKTTKKGKDEPWFKARFKTAKGIGWRFEGDLQGHPYVELGFVVKHKQDAYVIRAQFGGEDAEKTLAKQWKAIQKAWKFNK